MNDLLTQVQIPPQTGNNMGGTLIVSAFLLIEWINIISLTSIVKSSRTSQPAKDMDLVAQWLSAVDE